ncbi:MAG: peroxide stress protein YaaA [Opitutales bacterium]|nr:peroxide stress protein YaaA [Opitutales bacterium]
MIILLSPAKTLDFKTPSAQSVYTQSDFLDLSDNLIQGLGKMSANEISKLMGVSPKLAELNRTRFEQWNRCHTPENAKQAALAFKGDVYEGLRAWEFNKNDFTFAQKHLRILSGLYGILRPLDLIQAHRLEMGTVYANPSGKDLYAFWGNRLAQVINHDLKQVKSNLLINLASQEYFKAAKEKNIEAQIISPIFKDEKNGNFKIISFYAKKARGIMGAYLIKNRVKDVKGLRSFAEDGYQLDSEESTDLKPVFIRSEEKRLAV